MRSRPTLVVLAAAMLQGGPNGGASELYPCTPSAAVVRFFHLETDAPELAKVNAALAELGAELAYGPRTSAGRPGHAFLALRAPPEVGPKKLAAALRKGGGAAEPLVCIAFDGREGDDHAFGLEGLGVTKRDFVMGMSGDIVWYDARGKWSQFYGSPGKLKAAQLVDRYAKLYAPYGGARLGRVVEETFRWTLAATPDEKVRKRVLAALEKLAGVLEVGLEGNALSVRVALDRLETCAAVGKLTVAGEALDEAGGDAPRAAFDTTPVYALLRAEQLVP